MEKSLYLPAERSGHRGANANDPTDIFTPRGPSLRRLVHRGTFPLAGSMAEWDRGSMRDVLPHRSRLEERRILTTVLASTTMTTCLRLRR